MPVVNHKVITIHDNKLLQKARLIELPEAKQFLTAVRVNNDFVNQLNTINLTKLNLTQRAAS